MKPIYLLYIAGLLICCTSQGNNNQEPGSLTEISQDYSNLDTATVAGGCFWCVEASFDQIKGVVEAVSGYAGGSAENANYKLVSSGRTDHAEAVQVYYDPAIIDYETILDIFFTAHDPTQVNRQGPDVGYQYRSAIFFHDDEQRKIGEAKVKELQSQYSTPIATQMNDYTAFYLAEDYHQDYEEKNPFNPYIVSVSKPKIKRVAEKFADRLKEED